MLKFNEFVLDTATKLNIVTNGLLPGEDTNNNTASKSADVQFDGVADDSDNNCKGKDVDDDTGCNCDGKDDDNCEGKDVDDDIDNNCDGKVDDDDTHSNCDDNDDAIDDDDMDRKRNMIDDNNSNKCMSSILSRDDEIQYYYMCVGYGAHLKRKMVGKKSGDWWKVNNWLQKKDYMRKISDRLTATGTPSMHHILSLNRKN
jgi:hypothetical protein